MIYLLHSLVANISQNYIGILGLAYTYRAEGWHTQSRRLAPLIRIYIWICAHCSYLYGLVFDYNCNQTYIKHGDVQSSS